MDLDTIHNSSQSSDDCLVLPSSPPRLLCSLSSSTTTTPQQSILKTKFNKAESAQRKAEREAKKAEEEAAKAEKKRLKEELQKKKAEELQAEKVRKAEEKAKREEEKAKKEEEKAKKEAENAPKKAEWKQKKEQKQAAAQKQDIINKQMANYMGKFFKPIDKPPSKDGLMATTNSNNVPQQRCTSMFDQLVSKQDVNFVSDIIENINAMKRTDIEMTSRSRLNSESNSSSHQSMTTTCIINPYLIKTRYIHFPDKYFNRPPYYGSFIKAERVKIDPLQPDASIENIDYAIDSESEWEEPCKDGEELRSDAEDLSDSEPVDSDSDEDSFIVPHGHLSDDELNEDEQQQSTSTKQAREAARSHVWEKKVARRNQQREMRAIFGCISDPTLDDKAKFELSTFLDQFRKILVPKEYIAPNIPEDKPDETIDESTGKEEKIKRVSKKKSQVPKKAPPPEQQPINSQFPATTAKRAGSVVVESSSPSKRRKINSIENCSTTIDDPDVIMLDIEPIGNNKVNIVEDANNLSADVKQLESSPIMLTTSTCTTLIPKRKQPPV